MAALVPVASARLAQDVYLLVDGDFSLDQNIERLKNRHSKFVDINKNSLLTATSGLGFIQARTAFGIAAFGVNAYAGHAFIRSEERRVGKECGYRWWASRYE